ncbi:hypothetical protein ACFP2T_27030 [Plantactinospora solaniradicis]|uniref:DUF3592 domain-containing protein n=1 Tax=Plantactinospora solaniradicis TaxID=1723736 RepID=A0ABW1KE49_9ACTN
MVSVLVAGGFVAAAVVALVAVGCLTTGCWFLDAGRALWVIPTGIILGVLSFLALVRVGDDFRLSAVGKTVTCQVAGVESTTSTSGIGSKKTTSYTDWYSMACPEGTYRLAGGPRLREGESAEVTYDPSGRSAPAITETIEVPRLLKEVVLICLLCAAVPIAAAGQGRRKLRRMPRQPAPGSPAMHLDHGAVRQAPPPYQPWT